MFVYTNAAHKLKGEYLATQTNNEKSFSFILQLLLDS